MIPALLGVDREKSLRLWDPPMELLADTRQWAEDYAMRQVRLSREHIFPLHGL